jgi:NAD(P)-dependent dehydrogenase (short-subunit alcohol dehydrogenase family)
VASIAGLRGIADPVADSASKHGLVGLTGRWRPRVGWSGVRVKAVCPGWVKTELDAADQASGASRDDITGQVPMGRFATPKDAAAAVAFRPDPQRVHQPRRPAGGWRLDRRCQLGRPVPGHTPDLTRSS